MFCAWIRQIDARLKFKVSARGFGYILENKGLITKIDFDRVEKVTITNCESGGCQPTFAHRTSGALQIMSRTFTATIPISMQTV